MQFILLNCTPKLKSMGIDPSVSGWGDLLTNKLTSYVTLEGWDYDYVSDTLKITPAQGSNVSTNLTDFGDAGGVLL
jgi:hypothetical protein